jgi:hypothetical protein
MARTAAPTESAAATTEVLFSANVTSEDQLDQATSVLSCAHGLSLFLVLWSLAVSGVVLYL